MRRRGEERRRAPRRRVVLRVRFDDGTTGLSRDVSSVGIFVETGTAPPTGSSVGLSVELGAWDAEGGFRIRGEGRVVRADTSAPRPGIGLDVAWSDVEALGASPTDETPDPP